MESQKILWCYSCAKFRPVTEFHRNRTSHTGYQSSCKSCAKTRVDTGAQKERSARHYAANRDQILAGQRAAYAEKAVDPAYMEARRKARNAWAAANRDKVNAGRRARKAAIQQGEQS